MPNLGQNATSLDICVSVMIFWQPTFAESLIPLTCLQSVIDRLLDSFCSTTSAQNISEIEIRISVEVTSRRGETSLWLEERWNGGQHGLGNWNDFLPTIIPQLLPGAFDFFPTSIPQLLPGAFPSRLQLLALLATQKARLPKLENFTISVDLAVPDQDDHRHILPFWIFSFPDQKLQRPTTLDRVESDSSEDGRDQAEFCVSRRGLHIARHCRRVAMERAQDREDESDLWDLGLGFLR